jgi:S-DNA-T family DNA segregation ATPase FtsK/SpoIIIE
MHMLLASQRLEEGKLRGLDTFLSYRIGLKTFSAAESRAAIGVPDAFELPSIPGSGYLKFDTSTMVRFKAAYVSGPYRPAGIQAAGPAAAVSGDRRAKLFVPDFVEIPKEPEKPLEPVVEKPKEDSNEPTELEVICGRLVGQGPPAHEVWLPPLDESPSLDTLLPPLSPTEDRGLSPVGFYGNSRLQVPLGLVDRPYEQRRDLLWADFSGAAGHAAIVGGPQSGKSMMLRTLIASMALTHTAEEAQFFCVDLGGGTLSTLEHMPHVGGVSSRLDPDKTRRMVAEVTALVGERELRFRDAGVDSMTEFRNRKRRGELRDDAFGDVFLVVDGWMNFRQEFEVLEQQVMSLASTGLSYGVHVIVSANRWAEIRPALKDLLGTRFELRLGDPSESDIDRRTAVNVPAGRPGRGLTRDKLHFLVGLPRIDGSSSSEDVAAGLQDTMAKVTAAWRGRHAPKVRLLPDLMPYEELLAQDPKRDTKLVPIGVNEDALAPLYLDFDADPHFMAFADGESGKTNLLRVIVRGILDRYTAKEAVIILVDYRRTMLGFISESQQDYLLGYAVSSNQLGGMINDVKGSMTRRLPGPDVTQDQLKNRSWWTGPELFLIVDDYDLVCPQGNNPLQPLSEFLAQAKDVGLHLITVRRTGGASRAMFDPIIGKLREIASTGMVMSGSKDEGALLGNVKPSAQPPGRGTIVSRKFGEQRAQIAWITPD